MRLIAVAAIASGAVACVRNDGPPIHAALVAPTQEPAAAAKDAPAPSGGALLHDRAVALALEGAVRARGLGTKGLFASKRVTRAEMDAIVRRQVDDELPPRALAHEASQQKLLSVIAPETDYGELVLRMLGEQIAGVYIPRDKALYVVEETAARGGVEERTVLLHEIVHAIQDEHFDLGRLVKWREGANDAIAAAHALGEGDATLAMLLDTSRGERIPESFVDGFTMLMRDSNRRLVGDHVPPAIADALVDPYVEGVRFAWARYDHGGWPAVDAAWRNPPTTTEQLLHPHKYDRREEPVPLPGNTVAPSGFAAVSIGVMGELDFRDWLSAFMPLDEARGFASGWGNGRVELFERGTDQALRVRLRWDDDARGKAERVATRLTQVLADRFGRAKKVAGFSCVERPGVGPIAFAHTPRELSVLAGPAPLGPSTGARIGDGRAPCSALAAWAAKAKPAP